MGDDLVQAETDATGGAPAATSGVVVPGLLVTGVLVLPVDETDGPYDQVRRVPGVAAGGGTCRASALVALVPDEVGPVATRHAVAIPSAGRLARGAQVQVTTRPSPEVVVGPATATALPKVVRPFPALPRTNDVRRTQVARSPPATVDQVRPAVGPRLPRLPQGAPDNVVVPVVPPREVLASPRPRAVVPTVRPVVETVVRAATVHPILLRVLGTPIPILLVVRAAEIALGLAGRLVLVLHS